MSTSDGHDVINLPHDAIICNNVNYTDDAHIYAINVLYDGLIELMSNASDELVSQQGDKARLYKCRPGWNGHASDIHTARECFVMWVDAHKPKNGPVFQFIIINHLGLGLNMRCLIKNHETQLRKDSLAKKLSQSKPEDFWKGIRQINNCNKPLPNSVEGISGKEEITE